MGGYVTCNAEFTRTTRGINMMHLRIFLLAILLLLGCDKISDLSQGDEGVELIDPPETNWIKTIGGINDETIYSFTTSSDDNIIACGYAKSYGNSKGDFWIVKMNFDGDTIWSKTYGANERETAMSIIETNDGNYLIAGVSESFNSTSESDAFVLKINSYGDSIWSSVINGGRIDHINSIVEMKDRKIMLTGKTFPGANDSYDMWIINLDENGDSLWSKVYGGTGADEGESICVASDSSVLICGNTVAASNNVTNPIILELNQSGDTLWTKTFENNSYTIAKSIKKCSDGNFIVTGKSNSSSDGADAWIRKIGPNGSVLWFETIDVFDEDLPYSIIETADYGFALCGITSWSPRSGWIIKTNNDGKIRWKKEINIGEVNYLMDIHELSDGSLVSVGFSELDSTGNREGLFLKLGHNSTLN